MHWKQLQEVSELLGRFGITNMTSAQNNRVIELIKEHGDRFVPFRAVEEISRLEVTRVHDLKLTPIKGFVGELFGDFQGVVSHLKRPYFTISEDDFLALRNCNYDTDFYETSAGMIVTFGYADQGYALMPLTEEGELKVRKL